MVPLIIIYLCCFLSYELTTGNSFLSCRKEYSTIDLNPHFLFLLLLFAIYYTKGGLLPEMSYRERSRAALLA